MLSSDRVMWERELAEHLSRCERRHEYEQFLQASGPSRAMAWLEALVLWSPLAVAGTAAGWWIGWHIV